LAFSDPAIIRLTSEAFIPVAENSSGLERQRDDKGEFFRHIAERGHYGGRTFPTASRQGQYAFTADGRFLASINTRDPREMEDMLRTALARWRDGDAGTAPAPVGLADENPLPSGYPEDGLVLRVAARDLPREVDTRPDDWRTVAWYLDYAWFLQEEARTLVPGPRAIGARSSTPRGVAHRLARFHLRDFVRGEPFVWPVEAVQEATLTSEITGIEGPLVRLTLRGTMTLRHEARWVRPEDGEERHYDSGYDATLFGEAAWDDERQTFVAFDLVATGDRHGANQYNNREDDLGPEPMGIGFTLAGETPADRTPPHLLRNWRRDAHDGDAGLAAVRRQPYFQASETP
ncbi:MAG: hypothetical protein H0U40_01815, partial [Chloroflexia bacterium]|nr:hypothetical protein [Chloroflexia bacterium]